VTLMTVLQEIQTLEAVAVAVVPTTPILLLLAEMVVLVDQVWFLLLIPPN
jgi:hypothetical protein